MKYVYDTTELTARRLTDLTGDFVVPSKVMAEVRKGFLAKKLDSIAEEITVVDPDSESRNRTRNAADETGDLRTLSEADLDVIAVALMIGGTVVSDDYSVQNVCTHLGIPVQGSSLPGIRKEIKWGWRCTGCRKKYRDYVKACSVCGHELRRIALRERKV